jgi:hypothetical protein
MTARNRSKLLVLVPLSLYVLSHFVPSFRGGNDPLSVMFGWEASWCTLLCWSYKPEMIVGWLANPLFLTGISSFVFGKPKLARFTSLAAWGLSLLWPTCIFPVFQEGNGTFLSGYYLWVSSMGLLAFLCLIDGRMMEQFRTSSN